MTRIESALRKYLTDIYGWPMDAYRCHIESDYEHDPKLTRHVRFWRPDNGAYIDANTVFVDRGGWPVQWTWDMGVMSRTILQQYNEIPA